MLLMDAGQDFIRFYSRIIFRCVYAHRVFFIHSSVDGLAFRWTRFGFSCKFPCHWCVCPRSIMAASRSALEPEMSPGVGDATWAPGFQCKSLVPLLQGHKAQTTKRRVLAGLTSASRFFNHSRSWFLILGNCHKSLDLFYKCSRRENVCIVVNPFITEQTSLGILVGESFSNPPYFKNHTWFMFPPTAWISVRAPRWIFWVP